MAIPQVLSENEKATMKHAVNTYMSSRFTVSLSLFTIYIPYWTIAERDQHSLAKEQTDNMDRTR